MLNLRDAWIWRALAVAWFGLAAAFASVPAAKAVQPEEVLEDPKLESRAREISAGLRCLVCQNQSIDESNAPLARDLRLLVRERLKAGDDNDEILDYIVARYGEFVLLRPPVGWHTALLWLAPALFLLLGLYLMRGVLRRHRAQPAGPAPLSDDDQARLSQILDQDRDGANMKNS